MSSNSNNNTTKARVTDYVSRLTGEEAMLVTLKRELYDGCWHTMLRDLQNRLEGKPYIFKLANRILDDIKRIEKLKSFEDELQIDLGDFVKQQ